MLHAQLGRAREENSMVAVFSKLVRATQMAKDGSCEFIGDGSSCESPYSKVYPMSRTFWVFGIPIK